MEYPKWKYCQSCDAVIVQDANEEAALAGTWFDSPADFPSAEAQTEKDQLIADAITRGISIDKRWSLAKIKEALAAPLV